MIAVELKKYLVSKINHIDDALFLEKIKQWIDTNYEKVYELSVEQIQLVKEAENQYNSNDFVDDIEMDKKVTAWQKEK